jgi:hypothetical protein
MFKVFAPTANDEVAAFGVERNDDVLLSDALFELGEETAIYFSIFECGATDDDFFCAPGKNSRGVDDGANTSTDANSYFGARAKQFYQTRVGTFAHGGVQIDDVENWIAAEAIEQAEDVVDGESAFAPVN